MLIDVNPKEVFDDEYFLNDNISKMTYGKALIVPKCKYTDEYIFEVASMLNVDVKIKIMEDEKMIVCVSDRSSQKYEKIKKIIKKNKIATKSEITNNTRGIKKSERDNILDQLKEECFIIERLIDGKGRKFITAFEWIAD